MMEEKIIEDKVWVSVLYTVNLGNYENIKIEMGTSRTIGEQDPSKLRKKVCNELLDEVIEIAEHEREKMK